MDKRKSGYKLNLSDDARKRIGWRKGVVFTKITKICEICGKPFDTVPSSSKQYTCSRRCMGIRKQKPQQVISCAYCKKPFIPKAHKKYPQFCSRRCGAKSRYENHEYKIRPSEVLKRKDFIKCQVCGYSKIPDILERHHINMNHSENHIKNLMVLCPNCHDEIHFVTKTGKFSWRSLNS